MSKKLDVVQYILALAVLKCVGETPEIKRVVYNDMLIHDPEIYPIMS